MSKQSGLGDQAFVHGYDLSGDVASLSRIAGGQGLGDLTGINSSAHERVGLLRSGEIAFTSWFNDASLQEHAALSPLPLTNVIVSYLRGTTLGNPAACMTAKQVNYDPTRNQDGSLQFGVQALSSHSIVGLEWCEQLTAGKATHASATNGTSRDYGAASTAFGASAYWHLFDLASGTVDGEIQDSANDTDFVAVTGLGFTAVADGSEPTAERVATATGATIRQYVRFASTGTFTNADLWAGFIRHLTSTL